MKNPLHKAEHPFDLETFLPYKLSVVSRLTQGLLASALGKSGVTIAQWRVYLCLTKLGPMHLNGIADFTLLPQSSLSRSIAQMDERGLVRNARNENDRRISRVELTPEGRKHFELLTVAMNEACDAVFDMEPSQLAEFVLTIDKLIARLSGIDASGSQS
ncbi:MarR family winged helix-turn-helix transcriptional regulator [Ottowia thiooxydans]|uniref:MarR family winged helix-turn-helix transcriptional regulator n=1 Tax=Ottowia thiooxydans TaxID=219182 RepID=UPI00041EFD1E|nr:MarR family transcriptional regulator [Ottowia thiooxydans]